MSFKYTSKTAELEYNISLVEEYGNIEATKAIKARIRGNKILTVIARARLIKEANRRLASMRAKARRLAKV